MAFLYKLTSFPYDIHLAGYFEWRDLGFIGASIVFTLLYRYAKWHEVSRRRSRRRSHKRSKHKSSGTNKQP